MSGTASKLCINSEYLLFTNYGTINGEKVKVKAILNYEKANEIPFSIKNLAINEKVIDVTALETDTYIENQLYYLCISKDANGNENSILVWDDVIDSSKTTKLAAEYNYTLNLTVSAALIADLPTIENSITTFINNTYGNTVIPNLVANGEVETTLDSKTQELNRYKEMLQDAMGLADKMAKLKQIETLINYFAKDDMYQKIVSMSDALSEIQSTISTISAQIS